MPDFPGPLAGMLAGLEHCRTAYLVTVPCDSPNFPADLVARLLEGLLDASADQSQLFLDRFHAVLLLEALHDAVPV